MQKMVVIQTAFIGDVVLATALIESLHQQFPVASIDIVVRKGNETLFANHPFIEEVIVWDKKNNKYLQDIIDERNNDDALEILEYFHMCSSIRQTARKYNMDMEEIYESIPEWDGCRDGLQSADDYDECRQEVVGRKQWDEEKEDEYDEEELVFRKRTAEGDDLKEIIEDYKGGAMTIYEIADHHNLWINNLFRLLKENKVIEKETEVTDYAHFYTEHEGIWSEWDGKSELGLIEEFYKALQN